jgi:hypothetical protein
VGLALCVNNLRPFRRHAYVIQSCFKRPFLSTFYPLKEVAGVRIAGRRRTRVGQLLHSVDLRLAQRLINESMANRRNGSPLSTLFPESAAPSDHYCIWIPRTNYINCNESCTLVRRLGHRALILKHHLVVPRMKFRRVSIASDWYCESNA